MQPAAQHTAVVDSPIGRLGLVVGGGELHRLDFLDEAAPVHGDGGPPAALLAAYFDGDMAALREIRVAAVGGTAFQQEVWAALRQIPAGETISYAQLAAAVGRPSAVRAVGAANGANPVPLVVPCHRVIRSGGALGGYGGGSTRKQWLLEHERRSLHLTLV